MSGKKQVRLHLCKARKHGGGNLSPPFVKVSSYVGIGHKNNIFERMARSFECDITLFKFINEKKEV